MSFSRLTGESRQKFWIPFSRGWQRSPSNTKLSGRVESDGEFCYDTYPTYLAGRHMATKNSATVK